MNGEEDCLTLDLPELDKRYLRICSRRTSSVLLVISDLTEEYRLEQSRRDFIADAGHEFQTPLASIRLAAEFLMEGPKRSEEDEKSDDHHRAAGADDPARRRSAAARGWSRSRRCTRREEVDLCRLLSAVVEENRRHLSRGASGSRKSMNARPPPWCGARISPAR